jgi:hypothetical protein
MVTEKTRARMEFVGSIVSLLVVVLFRRRSDESEPLSRRWMIAGFVGMIPYLWAYDRDWYALKSSTRRRGIATIGWSAIQQFVLPENESVEYSFSIGMLAGSIVYRLWYGVLQPHPPSITNRTIRNGDSKDSDSADSSTKEDSQDDC